jgi:hypothetical protein
MSQSFNKLKHASKVLSLVQLIITTVGAAIIIGLGILCIVFYSSVADAYNRTVPIEQQLTPEEVRTLGIFLASIGVLIIPPSIIFYVYFNSYYKKNKDSTALGVCSIIFGLFGGGTLNLIAGII